MGIVVRSGMLKNLANSVCKSFNYNLKERRAVRKETRCKGDCDFSASSIFVNSVGKKGDPM